MLSLLPTPLQRTLAHPFSTRRVFASVPVAFSPSSSSSSPAPLAASSSSLTTRTLSSTPSRLRSEPAEKRPQPSWVRQPGPPSSSPSPSPARRNPTDEVTYREPPLVERARNKTVGQRNVFESYLVLPWNIRLTFWLTIAAVALAGLYGGDWLFPPDEAEKEGKGAMEVAAALAGVGDEKRKGGK
ncbi:hypothetical protein JCM8097_005262 [Rhodosporidiobolus ruineniae]